MTDERPQTLPELLAFLFTDNELRRWVSATFGADAVARLPQSPADLAELAFQTAQLINREGWYARVYPALYAARPSQHALIRVVERPPPKTLAGNVPVWRRRLVLYVALTLTLVSVVVLLVHFTGPTNAGTPLSETAISQPVRSSSDDVSETNQTPAVQETEAPPTNTKTDSEPAHNHVDINSHNEVKAGGDVKFVGVQVK